MSLADLNVVSILQMGVTGLGFLLALLAYWLLSKEQRQDKPRSSILQSVRVFMAFSFSLCLIGLVPQVLAAVSAPDQQATPALRAQIEELHGKLRDYEHNVDTLAADLKIAKSNSAKAVFRNVCGNQYFQCDRRRYAESQADNYRGMTLVEQEVCDLACN